MNPQQQSKEFFSLVGIARKRGYKNPFLWAHQVMIANMKKKEKPMPAETKKEINGVKLVYGPACKMEIGDVIVTMEGDNLGKIETMIDDDLNITCTMRKSFMTFEVKFPRMSHQYVLRFLITEKDEEPEVKTVLVDTPLKDLEVGDTVYFDHSKIKIVKIWMDKNGGTVECVGEEGHRQISMGYTDTLLVRLEGVQV